MKRPFLILLALLPGALAARVDAAVDAQPPTLFLQTTNAQFLRVPSVTLEGYATDDVGLHTLRVLTGTAGGGYTELTNLRLAGRSANWSVTVPLNEGMNYLLIRVFDTSNRSACSLATPTGSASCEPVFVVYSSTAARNPFEAWQIAHFTLPELLDPFVSGPGADPDGDGIPNLVECYSGLPPEVPGREGLPVAGLEDGHLTMTFARNKNATNILHSVRVSTNLVDWNSGPAFSALVSTQDMGATWQIKARATAPVTDAPARFMALDVRLRRVGFVESVYPILLAHCRTCHVPGGSSGIGWFNGYVYENLVVDAARTQENRPRVMPGFPEFSHLYQRIISTNPIFRMPYGQPSLEAWQIETIRQWIEDGTPYTAEP